MINLTTQLVGTSLLLLIWFLSSSLVNGQVLQSHCHSAKTCDTCVSLLGCGWCSTLDFKGGSRCMNAAQLKVNGCPQSEIQNPKSDLKIVKTGEGQGRHLKPERVTLKLRPNETLSFKVAFEQPTEYPLDLYYLMDLTYSMRAHQQKLVELADKLSASMSNITSNFRLGFGSFIDKVVMPYANMVPAKLQNPCPDMECTAPYGFRNHLSLTDNLTAFLEQVNATIPSANLDNAEGGFDALMQVMVCRDEIHWNQMSRKIVLFATDGIFHYAGDGKLGGIVKPNDASCHLNEDGYYTESSHQDYPALSQINGAINQNKMNIIYAVPQKELDIYKELSRIVDGSVTALLSEDSSNIVEVIQENYKRIVSKIELRQTASSNFKVKYFSNCLDKDGPKRKTRSCDGIRFGDKVEFDVQITATNCLKDGHEVFRIYPLGIDQDVHVEVTTDCSCNCSDTTIKPATACNLAGNLTCGVCACEPNTYGKYCDCQGGENARTMHRDLCLRNENSDQICSNRGDCVCGECQCNSALKPEDQIYGKFCECDTFSCVRSSDGQVCGGPSRGKCCDHTCECLPGWTGQACECSTDTSSCYNAVTESVCSGNGKCVCGVCECKREENGDYYSGKYCEDCVACRGKCIELEQCVRCVGFERKSLTSTECKIHCREHQIQFVDLNLDSNSSLLYTSTCILPDGDNCQISFTYGYDVKLNTIRVQVKHQRDCRQDDNFWLIIGTIAGLVFLIGLIALLVFRLLVYLKDRREFQLHAQNEAKDKLAMQTKETNPLYKEPETRYPNPLYKQAPT